jgi:hypothetical protein
MLKIAPSSCFPLAAILCLALGCGGVTIEAGPSTNGVAGDGGVAVTPGIGGGVAVTPGTGGGGGVAVTPGTGGGGCVLASDSTAACAAPAAATVTFSDAKDLVALIVGDWLRCEGPIQPKGMPVAPDGQDGIEFDLNPGEQQGQAGGLAPSGGPCLNMLLLYVGGGNYAPTSWAFVSTPTGPGLVFQDTFGHVVYDNPVFSDGGKRMVLSDPIYNGTYVRR